MHTLQVLKKLSLGMLMLRKIKPVCICPFQNSPAFNYLQTNTGRQKMIHGLIFSLSFVPPSPNLSTKKNSNSNSEILYDNSPEARLPL
jgi:hypothetical protein